MNWMCQHKGNTRKLDLQEYEGKRKHREEKDEVSIKSLKKITMQASPGIPLARQVGQSADEARDGLNSPKD